VIAITKQPSQSFQAEANEKFLKLVPLIERYAQTAFRQLWPEEREEAVCEVIANAFCFFQRLAQLGKLDVAYSTPLARYGVARFWAGRRVGGKASTRDVYSFVAQRRRRFYLESLQAVGATSTAWLEILADNRITPVLDQVVFRLDFRAWLGALKWRDRKLAEFLAVGSTPSETARQFRISRARVSQLRRELETSWRKFQAEEPHGTASTQCDSQSEAV
jgi:hypothetical protein